jgi:hypothetical protein
MFFAAQPPGHPDFVVYLLRLVCGSTIHMKKISVKPPGKPLSPWLPVTLSHGKKQRPAPGSTH